MRFLFSILAGLLLICLPAGYLLAEVVVLVPFGSPNIRYAMFEGTSESVLADHPEFVSLDYDDSGWALGTAPFGAGGMTWSYDCCPYCPVDASTNWGDPYLTMIARVHVNAPPEYTYATIDTRFAWAGALFINGEGQATYQHGYWAGCQPAEDGDPPVWSKYFAAGPNNVATFVGTANAAGWMHYLDFEISVEIPGAVPVDDSTWGKIKTLYR